MGRPFTLPGSDPCDWTDSLGIAIFALRIITWAITPSFGLGAGRRFNGDRSPLNRTLAPLPGFGPGSPGRKPGVLAKYTTGDQGRVPIEGRSECFTGHWSGPSYQSQPHSAGRQERWGLWQV